MQKRSIFAKRYEFWGNGIKSMRFCGEIMRSKIEVYRNYQRNFSTLHQLLGPSSVIVGKSSVQQLPKLLKRYGVKSPLLVTGKPLVDLGYVEMIRKILAPDFPMSIFSDTVEDPTSEVIEKGVAVLKNGEFDSIIAFGGGSPMDTAKGMSILAKGGGKMRDYKVPAQADEGAVPIFAIPTTAGTGSEVTRFTVVTDSETGEKMLIAGRACVPDAAIVDCQFTLSLPFRTAADTGIDALTHAIEAYVSQKANPFSDMYAASALKLIYPNLEKACFEPDNIEAKEKVMIGATLGGFAFSASSVALVHGMSRPLGAHFHVPHGLSNAMLLPEVTKFSLLPTSENALATRSRYADCARYMGVAGHLVFTDRAVEFLETAISSLLHKLEVPSPKAYGIDEVEYTNKLQVMAEQALSSGSPQNNPCIPSIAEMVSIYKKIYD